MAIVLVIGATFGIGREIAWQLATKRMNPIFVTRSTNRLEGMAECTRQVADVEVEVLPADLPQAEGTLHVYERLIDDERPVGPLVSNAGLGLGQDFVDGDTKHELSALNIMVRAALMTYHAAIPGMIARDGGGILNIASMATLTAQGIYSAHKAWVRTFTEGLTVSLKSTGISATVVCPDLVHTEFHEKTDINLGR